MKLKTSFFLFLTGLILSTLTSCEPLPLPSSPREIFIRKMEAFSSSIEKEGCIYNTQEWKVADNQYKNLKSTFQEKYSTRMTEEEKKKFGEWQRKYHLKKLQCSAQHIGDKLEDLLLDIESEVSGRTPARE